MPYVSDASKGRPWQFIIIIYYSYFINTATFTVVLSNLEGDILHLIRGIEKVKRTVESFTVC